MREITMTFGLGCLIISLVSIAGWTGSSDRWLDKSITRPQPVERVVPCAELYPPDPDREWDEELEEYVPINWDWRECMGVGRQ